MQENENASDISKNLTTILPSIYIKLLYCYLL